MFKVKVQMAKVKRHLKNKIMAKLVDFKRLNGLKNCAELMNDHTKLDYVVKILKRQMQI